MSHPVRNSSDNSSRAKNKLNLNIYFHSWINKCLMIINSHVLTELSSWLGLVFSEEATVLDKVLFNRCICPL